MTREEQLAYREERAEAAMFHICRDLYEQPKHLMLREFHEQQ